MTGPLLVTYRDAQGQQRPARLRVAVVASADEEALLTLPGAAKGEEGVSFPADAGILEQADTLLNERLRLDASAKTWYGQYLDWERKGFVAKQGKPDRPGYFVPGVPGALIDRLRPYQRLGVNWLREVGRGLLCDPVGAGKTIEALAASWNDASVLVVTPNLVKDHWRQQQRLWLKEDPLVLEGPGEARLRALDLRPIPRVTIINPEMLRAPGKYAGLFARNWDTVIIDEAHRLQGRHARQSQGAGQLMWRHLYMLTGTPVWNRPDSLWHLLHLLHPQRFSSYWNFVGEFCVQEESPYGTQIVGLLPGKEAALSDRVAPYMLYRRKEDILPDLPPKIVQVVPYALTGGQAKAYRRLKETLRLEADGGVLKTYASAGAALTDLRRIVNGQVPGIPSQKDDVILDLLASCRDQQVLVFTWLKDYAGLLRGLIAGEGYTVACITGDTSHPEMELAKFRAGDAQVMVATIASLGEGIDLLEATAAIFAEGSYSPVLNRQAEGRLHRIGTKVSPMIYRLAAHRTLEGRIWDLTDRHEYLSDELLAMRTILTEELEDA